MKDEEDEEEEADLDEAEMLRCANTRHGCIFSLYEEGGVTASGISRPARECAELRDAFHARKARSPTVSESEALVRHHHTQTCCTPSPHSHVLRVRL